MAKAGADHNTAEEASSAKLFDDMGYVISEESHVRIGQLAKACDYFADIAENVMPHTPDVTLAHFGPVLRIFGYVAADIANNACFSAKTGNAN